MIRATDKDNDITVSIPFIIIIIIIIIIRWRRGRECCTSNVLPLLVRIVWVWFTGSDNIRLFTGPLEGPGELERVTIITS